ncbi:MAG TPA: hypothetical protein VKK81_25285 [Candidatus Binatia bacterium]|nr:hypothetical protein [Candidatus Binatia bacterium]
MDANTMTAMVQRKAPDCVASVAERGDPMTQSNGFDDIPGTTLRQQWLGMPFALQEKMRRMQ